MIKDIKIGLVFPNPDQPRKEFDQDKLEELAQSIKCQGLIEPIVVTPRKEGFMIIAGERRWRASKLAGLTTITALIKQASDEQVEEMALVENIQREDLNIIEEGKAYQNLLKRYSVEQLAKKLGYKKTGPIYDRLQLLELKPEYQQKAINGDLTPAQAYELSRVPMSKQDMVFAKIMSGELGAWNKLYAFVEGLINLDKQAEIFALTPLTPEENVSINRFEGLIKGIERFISEMSDKTKMKALEKVSLHTSITSEKIDLIIKNLQKIRRTVLVGEGVKKAARAKAS